MGHLYLDGVLTYVTDISKYYRRDPAAILTSDERQEHADLGTIPGHLDELAALASDSLRHPPVGGNEPVGLNDDD